MGHANVSNLSNFFLRKLYKKGKLSIRDCVDLMLDQGIKLQASEGEYEDKEMLEYGVEQVVNHLLEYPIPLPPVINPVHLSKEQGDLLSEWLTDGEGDEWDQKEYNLLHSIVWKFNKGWRKQYSQIIPLTHISN